VRCPRCALRRCLCAEVTPLATRARVVVLRHTLERHKHSNSARWAALALTTCQVVDYGGPGAPFDAAPLLGPGVVLVYPDGASTPPPDLTTLLFLDGSWAQTRRMLQRIPGLAGLPRLSLPTGRTRRRLRRPPEGGLATLEAIAVALAQVEGDPTVGDRLDALYACAVERSCDPLVATAAR
jgi:DTW domain-containing protein YfiP